MSPILVAVDFSVSSLNAANFATDLALSVQTKVVLVHIIEIPPSPFPVPLTEYEFDALKTSSQESLSDLKRHLELRSDQKIEIATDIRYGTIAIRLEDCILEHKPMLLVMGKKGRTAMARVIMGSHSVRAIQQASCPVLVVPEDSSFAGIHHIAIASDLKQVTDNNSYASIRQILKLFHISPEIIHVNQGHSGFEGMDKGLSSLQTYFGDSRPSFHFIQKNNIGEGVLEFLGTHKTDMLVVMPEKHGLLDTLFKSSHSISIIQHTHLPVLSVAAEGINNIIDIEARDQEVSTHHSCAVCNGACASKQKKEDNLIDQTHWAL